MTEGYTCWIDGDPHNCERVEADTPSDAAEIFLHDRAQYDNSLINNYTKVLVQLGNSVKEYSVLCEYHLEAAAEELE